jgi:serine phosphatase RsbU (regulator of sigma subunit)
MDETTHMCACERQIAIGRTNGGAPTGDCARVVSRKHGETLCFLGDVTGQDSRAADYAREVEVRVGELAGHMSPGALLTSLNSALEAAWPSDMFVSAVCLDLNLETGRGTIALAGQMRLLVRSPTSTFWLDVKAGPALGVLAEQRYPERTFVLGIDDLLVMVTDGITDPLTTDLGSAGSCGPRAHRQRRTARPQGALRFAPAGGGAVETER